MTMTRHRQLPPSARDAVDMFDPEAPAAEEIVQLADALLDVLEYLDELGVGP